MTGQTDQEKIRAARRLQLLGGGVDVYPARTKNKLTPIDELLAGWKLKQTKSIAGRIRALRLQGNSSFLDLDDGSSKIQVFLQKRQLGDVFKDITKKLDLGDFLEIRGKTFLTKAGERSLDAVSVHWLVKALRPLPSNWYGLEDVELRYRHRELDLLADKKTRMLFKQRAAVTQALRSTLEKNDFLEVETPTLQAIPGGATARPFVTHHNALNIDLYLRIAPELYLKRLIVGGFPRVYEIGRCFRNEGVDRDHNPEFTQVELYAAYWDYEAMMKFAEQLVVAAAKAVNKKPEFLHQGEKVPLKTPFARQTYHQAIKENTGIDIDAVTDDKTLLKAARDIKTDVASDASRPKIIDELFKTHVRPKIIQPTFIYDYPIELSPLAKKKPANPKYTERFQLLMAGTELGNAFSELNDPVDQRERFKAQEILRAKGDEEAQRIDEDFLQALEYGMPPTAGLGIGIDRLTAVLTGQHSVKNVILFPTMKPKS